MLRAMARSGENIRQVARMKWKITRNPKREAATAAGAMPLEGTLAAIPTLLRLRWISSQSVHRTGYTPVSLMRLDHCGELVASRE